MKRVAVLHGPNLNLLGRREKKIYGNLTLADIDAALRKLGRELELEVCPFQSNSESEIIDLIQGLSGPKKSSNLRGKRASLAAFDALIINPAAYTHTSIAIRDALATLSIPVIEVHLSNIAAREEFRKISFVSPVATGSIMGLGLNSYVLALRALGELLKPKKSKRRK